MTNATQTARRIQLLDNVSVLLDNCANNHEQIKTGLCGAWLDSGVNILSFLSQFVALDSLELKASKVLFDPKTDQPYDVDLAFDSAAVPVDILIKWTTDTVYKKTCLIFERGILDVFHSQQAVYWNGEKLFEDTRPRLETHYLNYFTAGLSERRNRADTADVLAVHRILFGANDAFRARIRRGE